jgi:hypothetical protein
VPDSQPENQTRAHPQPCYDSTSRRGRLGYMVLGLASLAWLGLRSGTRPNRLVYPCQQVAAANGLGFLAYITALIASTRLYRYARKHLTFKRLASLVTGLVLATLLPGEAVRPVSLGANPTLPAWTSSNAVSDVFAVTNVSTATVSLDGGTIPGGISPAEALHDSGMDTLVNLMASQDAHFYKTFHQPDGIFAQDDVVVIKVNDQWNCSTGDDNRRAHTNVDMVKGVIYRIVQHPEGFTGAVIVADNGQGVPAQLDCADYNNAEDPRQSYQDVADAFAGQGYDVCTYTWDNVRDNFVSEYISGSVESGYVLIQDGTPGTDQLSYPKFEVTCGLHTYQISMRYGLWNGATYDNARLKMINLPVVKRHGMAGATIAVKNYIGFLTTANREARFGDFTEMHNFFWGYESGSDYGLLGRQLALIRRADLNVVDAVWVNPVDGWHEEDSAVRDNILLASTDPFAVDYYTSAYVLVPHMTPGSNQAHNADARYHGGDFRGLLLTNENRARLKGMTDIIDLDDSLTVDEEQAQFNVFVADASAPPDVTLSLTAEPTSRAIQVGQTAAYTLSPVINGGYVRPVTFALSGAPAETIVSLDPDPVIPPGTSQLYITTTTYTATGMYTMTVTGTTGQVTDTASLTLTVNPVTMNAAISLTVQPDVHIVLPGDTAVYTLSVTASEGFSAPVTLTLGGAPSDAAAFFTPNPVTPPGTSQLYITTTASTVAGIYAMTVTGTSGQVTDTTSLTLTVKPAAMNPAFSLTAQPDVQSVLPGEAAAYTLSVTASDGFTAPVTLTLGGAPSDAAALFTPNPVTPPGTSQLRVTTTASTMAGIYTMIVTGTSGALTDMANLTLIVASATPSFTLSISPATRVAEPNQIVSYTVVVSGVNGFSQSVTLTVVGLPIGVGTVWSINPVTPDDSSILTLSIPSKPSFGDHSLYVVGTAETHTVTKSVELIIGYPLKYYLPIILK